MERPERGFAREIGQDNTIRPPPLIPTDRPTPVRQEDDWSIPPPVERGDDAEVSIWISSSTCLLSKTNK